jgi:hypothetical protein
VIGERIWRRADLYFRQQLGHPFVESWDKAEAGGDITLG